MSGPVARSAAGRALGRLKRLLPLLLADVAKPYIGGQAVIEGVMMRSPSSFVVAVRKPDGGVAVRAQPWDNLFTRFALFRLPLLRGAVVLLESLWNGYVALGFSAEHGVPEEEKDGKKVEAPSKVELTFTLLLSLAFAFLLFKGVPHLVTFGIGKLADVQLDTTMFAFHAIDGVIKAAIFVAYLGLMARSKLTKRLFQYHGAEHKTIWAYEKGTALSVDDAAAQTTLHPRCGTSFLIIVLGISVFVFAAVLPFVPRLHPNELVNTLLVMLVKLPLMFPVAGLSFEFQRLSARFPKNPLLRFLTAPGLWMQRITTQEPSREQLEIAVIAMRRCIAYEEGRTADKGVLLFRDFDGAIAVP